MTSLDKGYLKIYIQSIQQSQFHEEETELCAKSDNILFIFLNSIM